MKSINQIFRNNKDLLDESEVQELIEYCQELEGLVYEKKQESQYDKQQLVIDCINDIQNSIKQIIKEDEENVRFDLPPIDYKTLLINLQNYITDLRQKNYF